MRVCPGFGIEQGVDRSFDDVLDLVILRVVAEVVTGVLPEEPSVLGEKNRPVLTGLSADDGQGAAEAGRSGRHLARSLLPTHEIPSLPNADCPDPGDL